MIKKILIGLVFLVCASVITMTLINYKDIKDIKDVKDTSLNVKQGMNTTFSILPTTSKLSNIAQYSEILKEINCAKPKIRQAEIDLKNGQSIIFNSAICPYGGDKGSNYFNNDFNNFIVKENKIYGFTPLDIKNGVTGNIVSDEALENYEVLKYWKLESEQEISSFLLSEMRKYPNGKHCSISMIDFGEIKEWVVHYDGPDQTPGPNEDEGVGGSIDPKLNCGPEFGFYESGHVIFSKGKYLVRTSTFTENRFMFDPLSVSFK